MLISLKSLEKFGDENQLLKLVYPGCIVRWTIIRWMYGLIMIIDFAMLISK